MNSMNTPNTTVKPNDNSFYIAYYYFLSKSDSEMFYIYFTLENPNIRINCYPNDNLLFLDDYQIIMSLNDFYNLGKSFRQCDNINEVFESIKNLTSILGLNYSLNVNFSSNDITLILKNRLLNGSIENMNIKFYKYPKNQLSQFDLLRRKYLELKYKKILMFYD